MAASRSAAARARALWLRYDLRVDDHPALMAALDGATHMLPVYVFDPAKFNVPTLAGARKSSARRARFLLESVACLRKRLESRGSGLAVSIGAAEKVLPRLCNGCEAVYVTQGVCSEETEEEERVANQLRDISLRRVWGNTLYEPKECGNDPSNVPLMFTQFKNRAESRGRIREPLNAPQKLPGLLQPEAIAQKDELASAFKFLPTLEQLGYTAAEAAAAQEDDPRGVMPFEGGEDAALHRLKSWMFDSDRLKEYFEIRNGMLGEGYSSKLSPWLALGCISPRRIWLEAQRYERERVKNKSTYWLVFELTWRDFFIYMGLSQGNRIFHSGGVTGERMRWTGTKDALQKWKEGRTGDQLVDANMRELQATGFMSNRGRQNVASYLIFNLNVDWRYGAAHFEELLLDHDPCSNWGNWVAAAGLTGQRINKFNTKKQLNDYDPNREYVNHWLKGGARDGAGSRESSGSQAERTVTAADDVEEDKRRSREQRFGTGGGKGDGGRDRGKGGRGKGGRSEGYGDDGYESRKNRRWTARNYGA
eukprot:TRINITY_DN10920_c0_g1_i1.p1 TRINITY_DN10920_c0_g1~~TRINITY_DN10920_c0_g1_i1.p1  ORF type:complete len:536 (+),score=99.06 TRINITY_DN10920_c0_g1_i1:172-1779(+)